MNFVAAAVELAKGGIAGLVLCVPPGVMGPLCVARSVRHGFTAGFSIAAGSALGDATYVAVAAYGVASLRPFLGAGPRVVAVLAAPLLLWAGVRLLARARDAAGAIRRGARPAQDVGPSPRPARAAATGYAMALGTPGSLPALVVLFAALGSPSGGRGLATTVVTAAGALIVALCWWTGVALVACRCRLAVARHLHVIDAVGGAFLVLASLAALHVAVFGEGPPPL
jgi:threonine/homoserine/homoserine lactone efflux protein